MDLTDQQWTIIEPLFEEKQRPDHRGARGATRGR
jgi:transposase